MNKKPNGGPDGKRETLLCDRKVDVKPVVQDLHNLVGVMMRAMETLTVTLTVTVTMMFAITGFLPLRVPAGTSTKISITWRSTLEGGLG